MESVKFLRTYLLCFFLFLIVIVVVIIMLPDGLPEYTSKPAEYDWNAPDSNRLPHTPEANLIRYGRELIANTAFYLGPNGKVAKISNGMNCQNCHLDAGTRFMGNNYAAVYAGYPVFRARSGTDETIYKRINDCLERSLNGAPLDTGSREIRAMYAYMKWLGEKVPKKIKPAGTGIAVRGQQVYRQRCERCHGINGAGQVSPDSTGYAYPPLWGAHSFNTGAGLYRLSRFAGYVKFNMPYNNSPDSATLTDAEAWDVAAFVNSRPRPHKTFPADWPNISLKPVDHPFAPYADSFPEAQHKYGPFTPIEIQKKKKP